MRRDYEEKDNNAEVSNVIIGEVANANLVNVRNRPDINSEVLRIVKHGEKFKIISGPERGFYGIEHKPDEIGYIHADYFKPI